MRQEEGVCLGLEMTGMIMRTQGMIINLTKHIRYYYFILQQK